MPNLTIKDNGSDFIHQIDGELASIGRADTNTVTIHDGKASKEHCRVERFGQRWKLVDLESKNGTRVNGHFRNKAWLGHGDMIEIGKAEIRFGVEGGSRRAAPAAAPPRRASGSTAPASARARREEPAADGASSGYEDERLPARRRYAKSTTDKLVMAGGILLGALIIFVVASKMADMLSEDTYNNNVLKEARTLKARGQWEEAFVYLQKHGDPEGNAYARIEREMEFLKESKQGYYANRAETEARKVLSDLGRKVKAYNQGKQRAQAEDILKLVQTLKTKYPSTPSAKAAMKQYRAWFAGKVPERASDILASGGQLLRDWQETEEKSEEYVKQWRFLEARETIQVFLSAREAVLSGAELEKYRAKVAERLRGIDQMADSNFQGVRRRAWDHEKKKRYDAAIKAYQEVIDKFGIDSYIRRAQAEINKLKAKKPG